MEQILLAYSLPQKTDAAIMMVYKNTKVKVCSPDGDTDFFDIVAGVLQRITIALYLFIIGLDFALWMSIDLMKQNGFTMKKARRWYPVQTITDVDDADDIVLLVNTPAQAESLLHSLKKAAGGICLHVNADKTEYMYLNQNQTSDFSTLRGGSLKLVDKLTYLGSSVSPTENDFNTRLANAWSAIERLSVI